MTDITSLTDNELAAAADEYIRRVLHSMAHNGLDQETCMVMLLAHVWPHRKGEFEISHKLHYGNSSNEVKLEGSNLFQLRDKHLAIAGIKTDPPTVVTPMLAAPEPSIDDYSDAGFPEEAEFTEVIDTPPF